MSAPDPANKPEIPSDARNPVPMDQDAEESHLEASTSQSVSKEVESLNQLFTMLDLENEDEEEVEIGSEGNPTKDDLLKLLCSYQKRLHKKANGKGLLLVRFNDAKQRLRRIQLERSVKDDALLKLTKQKEALLETLVNEVEDLRKDIEELKDALSTAYGHSESPDLQQQQEVETSKFSVKWNPNIPEHVALYRIFKEENIPLIEDSDEVDYSKIKKRTFQGAPTLDLDVSKLSAEDMVTEVATRVVTFRNDFERHYRWSLTDDLFDKMAWDYMPIALSKAGLAKDYTDLIIKKPMKERTWKQVVACLNKALKFELIEAYLADEVLTTRPKAGESFLAFHQRLKPLLEAAEFADDGCSLLIKALGNHISDIGFQATLKEYGSFEKVTSIKEYLEFLGNTPGAMEGSKTNHTHWFLK
ncbi:hypothetical protein BG011_001421, partial [Mortierella polycephala]